MTTRKTFYSDDFPREYMGVVTGSAYTKFPNAPGTLFYLKAASTNIGSFKFGFNTGSMPFELDAGEAMDWFTLAGGNLNTLYGFNSSGSAETMTYWVKY